MSQEPSSTAQPAAVSLYAALARTRRDFARYAAASDGGEHIASQPSAVIHPYNEEAALPTVKAQEHRPSRATLKRTIEDLREGLLRFQSDVKGDAELTDGQLGEAFASSSSGPRKRGESAAAAKQSNGKKRLASLLREQSTHAVTSVEIGQSLEAMTHKRSGRSGKLRYLPECIAIGALSATMASSSKHEEWPTQDHARASLGLKDLVAALEKLAVTELGLEAFSEEHDASSAKHFTLALAGKILVIDLEVGLQETSGLQEPALKARISYATDGSGIGNAHGNGNGHTEAKTSGSRDGKLAQFILSDIQTLSSAIFGLDSTTKAPLSHEKAVAVVSSALSRLFSNIGILQRLDELSSRVKLVQHPDLFSALENATTELSAADGLVESQAHHMFPYYSTTLFAGASLGDHKHAYTLRVDIDHWSASHLQHSTSQDALPSLIEEAPAADGSALQYTAILRPNIAMPAHSALGILAACGIVSPPENSNKESSDGDISSALDGSDDHAEKNLISLCRVPFASSAQLVSIIEILRPLAQFDSVLRAVPSDRTLRAVHGKEGNGLIVNLRPQREAARAAALLSLDRREVWSVDGCVQDGEQKARLDDVRKHDLSQRLNSDRSGAVTDLLAVLDTWAAETSLAVEPLPPAGGPEELTAARNLKRRRSSAAATEAIAGT